jgi:hypothetical protein
LLITTDESMYTIVMGIQRMVTVADSEPLWNLTMAVAMLALLPPVVVVLVMQRWFVEGLNRNRQVTRNQPMASVVLDEVRKSFGRSEVIKGVTTHVADGELRVVLGPSGCGKSTILRMIAGREEISAIRIGERVVNRLEPKDRDIAMVFQNYALYPHIRVFDNMAYGLRNQGTPKAGHLGDSAGGSASDGTRDRGGWWLVRPPLRVTLVEALGADTVVHGLMAGSDQALAVRLAATSRVAADDRLALSPDLGRLHLFDPTTGRRLDG